MSGVFGFAEILQLCSLEIIYFFSIFTYENIVRKFSKTLQIASELFKSATLWYLNRLQSF